MSKIKAGEVMSGNAEVIFDGCNLTIIISGDWKFLHYNVYTDDVIEKIKKTILKFFYFKKNYFSINYLKIN